MQEGEPHTTIPTPEQAATTIGPLRAAACGLAMGTADAVPGVSGGTIALILGIYDRFIGALGDVVGVLRNPTDGARWKTLIEAMKFLVPLGAGAAIALFVATKLLVGEAPKPQSAEEAHLMFASLKVEPKGGWLVRWDTGPIVFAFFFGLVLASIREPWKERRTHRNVDFLFAAIGAAAAVTLSLSQPGGGSTAPLALLGAGAVAVSVMLLPGVSGSLALLVLGMYQVVTGAIHAKEWTTLAYFATGMVAGVALFVPLLKLLLAKQHDRTMALLSGLMAGSLAALWPWKTHYLPKFIPYEGAMTPVAPSGSWWWPVLAAVAGAAVITLASRWANRVSD